MHRFVGTYLGVCGRSFLDDLFLQAGVGGVAWAASSWPLMCLPLRVTWRGGRDTGDGQR